MRRANTQLLMSLGAVVVVVLLGTAAGGFLPVNAGGGDGGGDGGLACGPNLVCNPATQYCSVLFSGPMVTPNYACADLPEDCPSPPTCECIRAGIGCDCTESDSRVTVTCTAP